MRTATTGQLAQLRATACDYAVRVRLWDATGAAREWTGYLGTDWLADLEITREIESPAARLALTIVGGEPTRLASPLVTGSSVNASGRALNPGRRVTVEVQSTAPNVAPVSGDWVPLFDGVVDELDVTGPRIGVQARDGFGPILDATFDAETTFASNDIANVLRAMLNDRFGSGAVPLVVPVDPGWTAPAVTVTAGTSLGDAMLGLVRQLGWRLEYRWAGNVPELQLLEPNRAPTVADWSLTADDVLAVREVRLDRLRLRNRITVVYRDPSSRFRQSVTAEDTASIAANGVRALVIRESATSEIRTNPQALRMAQAILADLKDLGLAYQIETRALWPVEIGDVLDIGGLPAISDSTQRLAVQRHVLRIGGGQVRSSLLLRGRPASQSDSWFRIGDGQVPPDSAGETTASASFTSSGAVRVNVIGPLAATAVRAAVSDVGPPTGADVDAATGSLAAAANMAALTSTTTYAVGTTVYVAAAAYVGGVRGRVIQLVVQRDADAGDVAVGPDLDVNVVHDDTTATITWVGSGTVTLVEDGAAPVTPPASPFTRSRAAAGSNTVRSLKFTATAAGQTMTSLVQVLPRSTVDTDTVAPDLRVIRAASGFGDAAQFVGYDVLASNPKAGGTPPAIIGTWVGTTVERFVAGTGWVVMTSGATLFSGDFIRMSRPANGSTPGTFTARATITGGGAEEIVVTVPQQAVVLPPAVVCAIVSSTETTITVRAETVPAGGTVRWEGGTAVRLSGPLVNEDNPSPQDYTFARPAFQAGAASATFRGTVNGVSDNDVVTIEEQGRDTVPLLTRARVIDKGATTYTIRVSASAATGNTSAGLAARAVLVERGGMRVDQGASTFLADDAAFLMRITNVDGFYGALSGGPAFIDFVVHRPAVGAQPARVMFRVDDLSGSNIGSDADAVDIEPQRALVPGRIAVVGLVQSGADVTMRFRAFLATGVERTAVGDIEAAFASTPPTGAPSTGALTVTRDTINGWFTVTRTRVPGAANAIMLAAVDDTGSGTARVELPVTVPTFSEPAPGGSDGFASIVFTADVALNQFTLTYTLSPALAGATVVTSIELLLNDDTNPPVAGVAGSRGAVTMPWTPDVFTLVPFSGATTTYLARVVLQALVAGEVAATSFAGVVFYVDNTGA